MSSLRRSRRAFGLGTLIALLLLVPAAALAIDPVNKNRGGVAIKGYDPVAYFEEGEAVEGTDEFEHEWQGATWRFSSATHRDLFAADPEKYSPQYGGYCAYAVSQGSAADIDPHAWTVVEGRLYLNLNRQVQRIWSQDISGNIQKADTLWPAVLRR